MKTERVLLNNKTHLAALDIDLARVKRGQYQIRHLPPKRRQESMCVSQMISYFFEDTRMLELFQKRRQGQSTTVRGTRWIAAA